MLNIILVATAQVGGSVKARRARKKWIETQNLLIAHLYNSFKVWTYMTLFCRRDLSLSMSPIALDPDHFKNANHYSYLLINHKMTSKFQRITYVYHWVEELKLITYLLKFKRTLRTFSTSSASISLILLSFNFYANKCFFVLICGVIWSLYICD